MTPQKTVSLQDCNLIKLDGFDDCLLGLGESFGGEERLIYSKEKILLKLQASSMSPAEALEYFEFNILGAYVGETMPIFLSSCSLEELENMHP